MSTKLGNVETSGLTITGVTPSNLLYLNASGTVANAALSTELLLAGGTLSMNSASSPSFTGLTLSGDTTFSSLAAKLTTSNTTRTTAVTSSGLQIDLPVTVTALNTLTNFYGLYLTAPTATLNTTGAITNYYTAYFAVPLSGTNKFSAGFAGNVSVGGTLGVTGATTLSSTLGVTGDTVVNGKFAVGTAIASYAAFYNSKSMSAGSGGLYGYVGDNAIFATTGGTVPIAANMYLYKNNTGNLGTITDAYALYVETGNTAGTITNGYGIKVFPIAYGSTNTYGAYISAPSVGTNRTALYTDNMSVGYTAATSLANLNSTNNLIIAGNLGVGLVNPSYALDVVGKTRHGGAVTVNTVSSIHNYTQTISAGSWNGTWEQSLLYINPTVSINTLTSGGTSNYSELWIKPNITMQSGNANALAYYAAIKLTTGATTLNTGSIVYGYGIYAYAPVDALHSYSGYFNAPTVGTNKAALYADNMSVGYTGSTFLTNLHSTNNLIVAGNLGVGLVNPSYKLDVTGTTRLNGSATFAGTFSWVGVGSQSAHRFNPTITAGDFNGVAYHNNLLVSSTTTANLAGHWVGFSELTITPNVTMTAANTNTLLYYRGLTIDAGTFNINQGFVQTVQGLVCAAPPVGTYTYAGYFIAPTGGTNRIALYTDNMSVGYTAATTLTNLHSTNNLVVAGRIGIGLVNPSYVLDVVGVPRFSGTFSVATTHGHYLTPAITTGGQNGAWQTSHLLVNGTTTVNMGSSGLNAMDKGHSEVYIAPNITMQSGNANYMGYYMGLRIDSGTFTMNTGNISYAFGLYCKAPTAGVNTYAGYFVAPTGGTNRTALYADNMAVGYVGTTTLTNLNGTNNLIVAGNLGIGLVNPSYKLDVNGTSRLPVVDLSTLAYSVYTLFGAVNNRALWDLSPATTIGTFSHGINTTFLRLAGVTNQIGVYSCNIFAYLGIVPNVSGSGTGLGNYIRYSYGIKIDPGTYAFDVYNIYGAYISAPATGSTNTVVRQALYSDNMSIGYPVKDLTSTNNLIVLGSLGVGTDTPGVKLDVIDTTAAYQNIMRLRGSYAADGYGSYLSFTDSTPTDWARIGTKRESNNNIGILFSTTTSGTLSEKVRINAAGRVGVGTDDPGTQLTNTASANLVSWGGIGPTGTGIAWRSNAIGYVASVINANTTATANGLGISTQTTDANSYGIHYTNGSGSPVFVARADSKVGIGTNAPLSVLNINAATVGSGTNDCVLTLRASSTSALGITQIRAVHDAVYSYGSALTFSTRNDNGVNFDPTALVSEKMRITNNGNVGIGTSDPKALLSLYSNDQRGYFFSPTALDFYSTLQGQAVYKSGSNYVVKNDGSTTNRFAAAEMSWGTMRFLTYTGATTANVDTSLNQASFDACERMRITAAGSVAIGTGAITATNATDGFLYIPGVAAAPTGVPSTIGDGNIYPICFCNANNRLYVYNGGWVSVALV